MRRKGLLKNLLTEIKILYSKPRDIHRVLMMIFIGGAISHAQYLHQNMTDSPLVTAEIVSITLASCFFVFLLLWVILSGEMNTNIFWRSIFMGGWAGLGHRMIVYGQQFSDVSMYAFVFSWVCMIAIGFFALTGKTKKDFDQFVDNIKRAPNEKTEEKGNILDIADRNTG